MKKQILKKISNLYSSNLQTHDMTSKSVGWTNEEGHTLRFQKLLEGVDFTHIESLNDLGAGYGAVLDYLGLQGLGLKSYFAYDISQNMLDAIDGKKYPLTSIEKFPDPILKTSADFSIASGIFNVKFSENEEAWNDHIFRTLHNLNEHSTYGFSFNLLSTYVDFKRDHLFYGDPLFFFDYCKRNFSKYVSLYHDYPLWEWTILVKR